MENIQEENLIQWKTTNYVILEDMCRKLLCEEISSEKFLDQLNWFREVIKKCENEHSMIIADNTIDSEEVENAQNLYLKGVGMYKEVIMDLESYIQNKDKVNIEQGLIKALKANKILLNVQELAKEKENQIKELEAMHKKYFLQSKMATYMLPISRSCMTTPIESPEIREKLEYARKKVEIIKLIPIFSVLQEKQIEKLESRIKLRKYEEKTVLFNEGDISTELYIIKSGEITIYKEFEKDDVENLVTLYKGDILGDMGVVLDSPRTLSAKVSSSMAELYVISKDDFLYILRNYSEVCLNLTRIHCRRIKESNERLLKYLCHME